MYTLTGKVICGECVHEYRELFGPETEKAPVHIEHITNMLCGFNMAIKVLDEKLGLLGLHKGDKDWKDYENEFHDRYKIFYCRD